MTLTETTNTEPLLRQGVFARVASFAHRRRWLALTLWAAALNLVGTGSALGAMKVVRQDGLFCVEAGPIEAFLPVPKVEL